MTSRSVSHTVIHQRSQKEGSPHYVPLNSNEESSNIDEDNIALTIINQTTSALRKVEVINVQVKPGDTLQALALRYRCTIAELKRMNKIDKDNEIHAKAYIKVPIQPYSILTETLTHSEECTSNTTSALQEKEVSAGKEEQLIDTDVPTYTESLNNEINTIILNSVCEPLSSNNTDEVSHTETDQLLPQNTDTTDPNICPRDVFNCSGDDCGLSWAHLCAGAFLLVFIVPIIYIYI